MMIKINDLRIGNWVVVDGHYYQIKHINFPDGGPYISPSMSPITLEEDMLENIGFKLIAHDPVIWKYQGFEIQEAATGYHFFVKQPIGKTIVYLHELQNTFHAINGFDFNIQL